MIASRDDCLNQWDHLWADAARVVALEHVRCDEAAREPLQLVVGALVYHRKALAAFDDSTIHQPVRQDRALLRDLLALSADELNTPATDQREVLGGMHIASAALRLPTAVLETIDARRSAGKPFKGLIRETGGSPYEWNRGECAKVFGAIQELGHCQAEAVMDLRIALVLLLLHRDDFGHGEEGKGPLTGKDRDTWLKYRQQTLGSAHRCRVFEAQQLIARWALTELEQK